MRLTKADILSKNLIQLFLDGFKLFFKNALIIIPFFLSFSLISFFINSFLIANFINIDFMSYYSLDLMLKGYLDSLSIRTFSLIAYCPIAIFIYEKYIKGEASFVQIFKSALNYRIFLVWIFYAILIPTFYYLIYLFTLIPLVIFLPPYVVLIILFFFLRIIDLLLNAYYIFMIFSYNIRDRNSLLTKLRFYRKGAFFKIFFILAIYLLLIELLNLIIGLFWNPSLSDIQSWYIINEHRNNLIFLDNFLSIIPFLIFGGLKITLLTPLFTRQVAKRAQNEEAKRINIGKNVSQSILNQNDSKKVESKNVYCPFCGKLRLTNENYCIHCGKFIE